MSLDSNGGYGSDMPGFSRNYDGPYVNRLWYPDGKYLEREEQQTDPTMYFFHIAGFFPYFCFRCIYFIALPEALNMSDF